MIRIAIVTLAILLACAPEAAAQSAEPAAPRLKELVAVSSEIVRIGDLVDNAGAAANVAVFRAPDLGQTGPFRPSASPRRCGRTMSPGWRPAGCPK